MEEVVYLISVDLLTYVNGKQVGERRKVTKATPYVKMESYTPDSESSNSEAPEQPSNYGGVVKPIGMTPRLRRIKGVDFPRSRRINFDLAEDENEAKN